MILSVLRCCRRILPFALHSPERVCRPLVALPTYTLVAGGQYHAFLLDWISSDERWLLKGAQHCALSCVL
jgi:hypothetical protein